MTSGPLVSPLSTRPYWLDAPARRYAPLEGDERVDVAVVGGGVTGLSCARALAAAGVRVRVLEARQVGGGASGRNGGFALRGLAVSYGERRAPDLWRLTYETLVRMTELAGDAFRPVGSLDLAVSQEELEGVRREHDALLADGFAVEWVEAAELPPVLRPHFLGGAFHPVDGLLEPGRWTRRLARLAEEAGARIAEDTTATALAATSVRTERGTVAADHVVLATDGYTRGLAPDLDDVVTPARNQMLATSALPERHFEPAVYARSGYDYWQQTREGRIVIGGWRDADLEREITASEDVTSSIQGRIEAFLERMLGAVPEITHRWAGLIGLTPDRLPLVGPLPGRDGVWVALGYS
ncbi:MAG: FAD-binding oxidoreductase, partial [Actinomycetota bacterium]|nr:FAD-binding oxidoreductase [Actinomycetota bacterium]